MARPAKVGGLRTSHVVDADSLVAPLPSKKQDVYQFRSKAASLRLSLKRRRTGRDQDGVRFDDIPRCTDGHDTALDWVFFEENNFETKCPQLAGLIQQAKGYGVGLDVWSLDDEKAAHDLAYERELRERITSRPDIAARVLKPSDSEDFVLPQPPA